MTVGTAERPVRKLVVVGDSLTFYMERDTVDPPLDDPRTMPFRIAAHLGRLTGEPWSAQNLTALFSTSSVGRYVQCLTGHRSRGALSPTLSGSKSSYPK